MQARISASAILVLLALSLTGCDDSNGAALQSGPTRRAAFQNVLVSVTPSAIAPEFLSTAACGAFAPFRTRFNLLMRADREVFLRHFGFELRDLSGGRALPIAALTSLAPVGQASRPLPIPTSPAVTIPGTLPFHGMTMSVPLEAHLALQFDCGVSPRGTLFIDVETADADGVPAVSRISVDVGN